MRPQLRASIDEYPMVHPSSLVLSSEGSLVVLLLAERARSEGARSMRAVKGSLGHSLNRGLANWRALARVTGTSRRASGWAGEKVACE